MDVRVSGDGTWVFSGESSGGRPARRGVEGNAASGPEPTGILNSDLERELARAGLKVADAGTVVPNTRMLARRGTAQPGPITLTVVPDGDERAIMIARHPSGALTFHAPSAAEPVKRSSRVSSARAMTFHIELGADTAARRSLAGTALRIVVVKIREKLIDAALRIGIREATRVAETLWWKNQELSEGWRTIESDGDGIALRRVKPVEIGVGGRSLLFLHGTFSDTAGSFAKTLRPDVLRELRNIYKSRIYAFEHFTVSRDLEENARMLLEFLEDREHAFDVVGYSRGGLVLRTLTEQADRLGTMARRLKVGRGVLVAVPNGGTPLATPQRWEDTFGLLATLLELPPDNALTPLTTSAAFIADGLVWLAGHMSGDAPGLEVMDANSTSIETLQRRDGRATVEYSAIGANYQPSGTVWQKVVDAGVDTFFAGANDLVVPSDGALAVDPGVPRVIPAGRIACFGQGGNLRTSASDVHHLNVLGQEATATFILRALRGADQDLAPMDLSRTLPSGKTWRGNGGAPGKAFDRAEAVQPPPSLVDAGGDRAIRPGDGARAPAGVMALAALPANREGDRTLQLMVVNLDKSGRAPGRDPMEDAQIIATYGSARVVEPFGIGRRADEPRFTSRRKKGNEVARKTSREFAAEEAAARLQQIDDIDREIRDIMEGQPEIEPDAGIRSDTRLRAFGGLLFETLFTARVRRLYDLARSEQREQPLNVVFTSNIPRFAAKPWEFCLDPSRRKFLATEDIQFVRNALTAVPAQRVYLMREKLRILLVEAQPTGTSQLSLDEEKRRIRSHFQTLVDTGLVEIQELPGATPESLHHKMMLRGLEPREDERAFDIVHFMGHGEFDREASRGILLFQSADGLPQRVNTQTLREILCNRGVQVVFLNACDTGRDDNTELNQGVAAALMEGGIPAVVANQYPVLDPSAVSFAEAFYFALANGASLGGAAKEARIAVNCSNTKELIDWAVPVLYARDADLRLCDRRHDTQPMRRVSSGFPVPKRTPGEAKPTTVGVADLSNYVSDLDAVLTKLNAAQNRFFFRPVPVKAPMGVWFREEDGTVYLDATVFGNRMKDKPADLGIDILACVTNWWMCDDEETGIYGWWSEAPDVPVVIFSTAGFALPTHGTGQGRVLANNLVSGIASRLVGVTTHEGTIHEEGPANCPFFYNEERDEASVAGELTICNASRRMLEKNLPRDPQYGGKDVRGMISAFEAMLRVFDEADSVAPPRSARRRSPAARTPSKKARNRTSGTSSRRG